MRNRARPPINRIHRFRIPPPKQPHSLLIHGKYQRMRRSRPQGRDTPPPIQPRHSLTSIHIHKHIRKSPRCIIRIGPHLTPHRIRRIKRRPIRHTGRGPSQKMRRGAQISLAPPLGYLRKAHSLVDSVPAEIPGDFSKEEGGLTSVQSPGDSLGSYGLQDAVDDSLVGTDSSAIIMISRRVHDLHLDFDHLERIQHEADDSAGHSSGARQLQESQFVFSRDFTQGFFDVAVGQEEDGVLGHGAQEGGRQAVVEGEEAAGLDGVGEAVDGSSVDGRGCCGGARGCRYLRWRRRMEGFWNITNIFGGRFLDGPSRCMIGCGFCRGCR
mmetsp:Transcript_1861/g.4245  ORF Transcript_1861/g.4245 Transcript_1861/m.4245 type:complete len:325 (-) Transcript_1861:249-1223(-)